MPEINDLRIFERVPPNALPQYQRLISKIATREYFAVFPLEICLKIAELWVQCTSPTLLSFLIQTLGLNLNILPFLGKRSSEHIWQTISQALTVNIVWQFEDSPQFTWIQPRHSPTTFLKTLRQQTFWYITDERMSINRRDIYQNFIRNIPNFKKRRNRVQHLYEYEYTHSNISDAYFEEMLFTHGP
ncbi:hypothetical protein [Parasitella parasitica]|uniref:Uncharacterized protein n=1 Tax=Parasitella parasitica TaxID=35722 RepID=A0A0B7MST9_9FUNG|nr:hypothetical protein [Parasitella parasitica]